MKTIFAKFNRERLPRFQTVTKIIKSSSGECRAVKEALCDEAIPHIENMYSNYHGLLKKYPHMFLVEPALEREGLVSFPMANGVSFERLMKEALENMDKTHFLLLLDKFIHYIDGFVKERGVEFKPCEEFKSVFGDWLIEGPQDIIEFANLDVIFSNLFLDSKGTITQIDYEWVFDFNMPKSLVLYWALSDFIIKTVGLDSGNELVETIFEKLNLSKDAIDKLEDLKFSSMSFFFGEERKYFLNPVVCKKQIRPYAELTRLRQSLRYRNEEVNMIYNSRSWWLTKPLRFLSRQIKKWS